VAVRRRGAGGGGSTEADDWVAVEEPLEIRLAWRAADGTEAAAVASITMRTPGQDRELAAGFLFTEGLLRDPADLAALEAVDANVVLATLAPGRVPDLQGLARHTLTGSACGVCGKTSLEALRLEAAFPVPAEGFRIATDRLAGLPAALAPRQPGFRDTGGVHAAALFREDGEVLEVREDVGRHNALDKLVGAAFLAGRLPWHGAGLLVSGRASFEILQKARMAGCPLVAAVGAPSSLAVELAWESGITLVGFLRDGRFNIYTVPGRIAG
jgi:FdhD protein